MRKINATRVDTKRETVDALGHIIRSDRVVLLVANNINDMRFERFPVPNFLMVKESTFGFWGIAGAESTKRGVARIFGARDFRYRPGDCSMLQCAE